MNISEKRLLGWEPTEVQEHEYDEEGRLIRTLVSRESEWDDVERAKIQGLAIYESQICDCGLHESISQTDPDMEIQLSACPVCAGIAQQMRILGAQDEREMAQHGDKPSPSAKRPTDGRRMSIRQKRPAEAR